MSVPVVVVSVTVGCVVGEMVVVVQLFVHPKRKINHIISMREKNFLAALLYIIVGRGNRIKHCKCTKYQLVFKNM